jgi:O-antigen biosynthesis protein
VRLDGPLRILVEGRPSVWFKGVPEALAAAGRMQAPHHVTVVAADRSDLPARGYDRVLGPLPQRELAPAYAETDVLLKLSRVEGMFGPPLEAFHMGSTCIVTPVTGHEEFVTHGWNGILTDWDDLGGTARWLDLLADDRRLLHFLRANALKTAEAWPSWRQSGMFMAAALRGIHRRPEPGGPPAARQALRDLSAGLEALRDERNMLEHQLRDRTDELYEHVARLDQATEALHAVRGSRAYKLSLVVRRLWRVVRFPVRLPRLVWRGLRPGSKPEDP